MPGLSLLDTAAGEAEEAFGTAVADAAFRTARPAVFSVGADAQYTFRRAPPVTEVAGFADRAIEDADIEVWIADVATWAVIITISLEAGQLAATAHAVEGFRAGTVRAAGLATIAIILNDCGLAVSTGRAVIATFIAGNCFIIGQTEAMARILGIGFTDMLGRTATRRFAAVAHANSPQSVLELEAELIGLAHAPSVKTTILLAGAAPLNAPCILWTVAIIDTGLHANAMRALALGIQKLGRIQGMADLRCVAFVVPVTGPPANATIAAALIADFSYSIKATDRLAIGDDPLVLVSTIETAATSINPILAEVVCMIANVAQTDPILIITWYPLVPRGAICRTLVETAALAMMGKGFAGQPWPRTFHNVTIRIRGILREIGISIRRRVRLLCVIDVAIRAADGIVSISPHS